MKKVLFTLAVLTLGFALVLSHLLAKDPDEQKAQQLKPSDNQGLQEVLRTADRGKIYFQCDKPLYKPGETIWFQPYFLQGPELTNASHFFEVELVNGRGEVINTQRLSLKQNEEHWGFSLPPEIVGGEYILRIKGREKEQDIRKIQISSYQAPRFKKEIRFLQESYIAGEEVSAIFSVKRDTNEAFAQAQIQYKVVLDDKTLLEKSARCDQEGMSLIRFKLPEQITEGNGFLMVTVQENGFQELKSKAIPIIVKDVQFALYPESGTFCPEVSNTLFFQAKTKTGKPVEIRGTLKDQNDHVVMLISSYHRGFGKFTFVPKSGQKYFVELTEPTGIAQKFSLPAYSTEGVHFSLAENKSEGVTLNVYATAPLKNASFICATRGILLGQYSTNLNTGENKVFLPITEQNRGIHRITLMTEEGVALAERLVFRKWGKDLKIYLGTSKKTYAPREKVDLVILTTNESGQPCSAQVCLSAVNDTVLSYADDKTAHLVTQTFLASEVQGEIFEPNFYFSTDPKSETTLDYLLNTQGWRKFVWKKLERPLKWEQIITDLLKQQEVDLCFYLLNQECQDKTQEKEIEKWISQLLQKGYASPEKVYGKPLTALQDFIKTHPNIEDFRRLRRMTSAPGGAGFPEEVIFEMEEGANIVKKNEERPAPPSKPMKENKNVLIVENPSPVADAKQDPAKPMEAKKEKSIAGAKRHAGLLAGENMDGNFADQENFRGRMRVRQMFPLVDYKNQQNPSIRTDFRETIYWNPFIKTDGDGKAVVSFYLSDSITSFRLTAEGLTSGAIGHTEEVITAVLPFYLQTKAPSEVTVGDKILLPVTLSNRSNEEMEGTIELIFEGNPQVEKIKIPAQSHRTYFYPLPIRTSGKKNLQVTANAKGFKDAFQQDIKAVDRGYLMSAAVSGVMDPENHLKRFSIELPENTLMETVSSSVQFYPSPVSTMLEGLAGMLQRPGGCFEQTTSSNYPNTMIMTYLKEYNIEDPALWAKASELLAYGYKRLAGFECKTGGYEWFGNGDGHEALTAMGLLQFQDMSQVYSGVEAEMMKRTSDWLKSRIDAEKGGYKQNPKFYHSWGSGKEITDAYIIYCLAEANFSDLDRQIEYLAKITHKNEDPYILALTCNALYQANAHLDQAEEFLDLLVRFQEKDGSFQGQKMSVVCSTGHNLKVETTALAVMALIKAKKHHGNLESAIQWLNEKRNSVGSYGATQATVLALKALTHYAIFSKRPTGSGSVRVDINQLKNHEMKYEKNERKTLLLDAIGKDLQLGKNNVEIQLASEVPLPYSYRVQYRTTAPKNSEECKVGVSATLERTQVKMGESVSVKIKIWNKTKEGLPMSVARIGFPGGLAFSLEELKELKKKGTVDFYETKPREMIFYFTQLQPEESREWSMNLSAEVPGTYVAEASSAYLYYTDEFENFIVPLQIEIGS